jgi:mRNA (guanine-N7-)-methyltransferase
MEIDTKTHDTLTKWIRTSHTGQYEIEAIMQNKITRLQFAYSMQYLLRNGWAMDTHPENLDISTADHNRTTIKTSNAIARYYNEQFIDHSTVDVIRKQKVDESILLEDFGRVKINMKTETPMEDKERIIYLGSLKNLKKGFRLKKRFSFVHTDYPRVRIDFTIIKSTDKDFYFSFREANLINAIPSYEMEVEITSSEEDDEPEEIIMEFTSAISATLRCFEKGFPLERNSIKQGVLVEYMKYVHPDVDFHAILKNERRSQDLKKYFAGPYPVTLELANILPPAPGVVSIFQGYCVTEKADGERYLAYVSNSGSVYFIDHRLVIFPMGKIVDKSLAGTLIDGEFVDIMSKDKNSKTNLYMIFDIYLHNGKDIRYLPLIKAEKGPQADTRLKHAMEVVSKMTYDKNKESLVDIRLKKYIAGDDDIIKKGAHDILRGAKAGNYPYHIDGVIYTPRELPVGAMAPNQPPTWGARWDLNLKWKPASENTIDFLVRFQKDGHPPKDKLVMKNGDTYKVVHLFVGFDDLIEKPVKAIDFLTGRVKQQFGKKPKYVPRLFQPDLDDAIQTYVAYLPLINNTIKCLNGDDIQDEIIVEFSYSGSPNEDFSSHNWKPLRIRGDKTEDMLNTGRITANYYKTAANVWHSIMNPVPEELITGLRNIDDSAISKDEVYYAKMGGWEHSSTKSMRVLHNIWIKSHTLLQRFKNDKKMSLLDLACGRGGDLWKWVNGGFDRVLGLDLFEDNISNPEGGAYSRLLDKKLPPGYKYIFVPYDVRLPIDAAHINQIDDASDRMVLQTLWGMIPKQMVKPAGLLPYYGFAKGGFDVVSCQFAIHYFFETSDIFDVFVSNVSRSTKQGGYFIGTCMDASRVTEKMKNVEKGQDKTAIKDGQIIWSIKKQYDDDSDEKFGRTISVYLESIDQMIDEFLVDYDLLSEILVTHGFKEVATGTFEESFDQLKDELATDKPSKDAKLSEEGLMMSSAEKEFSFLNRWFVFQKGMSQSRKTG